MTKMRSEFWETFSALKDVKDGNEFKDVKDATGIGDVKDVNDVKGVKDLKDIKIPLAPMGVLAPRLHTLDGPLSPTSALAEFFRCTFLQNNLHPQPQNGNTFYHFQVKIGFFRGVGGGPRNLTFIGILLFLLLRSPCKN